MNLEVPNDSSVVCNYQELLQSGVCNQCKKPLEWSIKIYHNNDKFCHAHCCLTDYSMVPQTVRIISKFSLGGDVEEEIYEDLSVADNDFINELRNM